ncbi:hypothetical protein ACFUGD_00690 [Streptomyces sp. NPDC057217]|uniref:hypothetical protein n=1 Tax=unclassified Streptomyces TaxID=2593676 RepID=UPI00363E5DCC
MGTTAQQSSDKGCAQTELLDVLVRGLDTLNSQLARDESSETPVLRGPVCLLVYWGIEGESEATEAPGTSKY